ncbi:MAG: LruC domain-containing protein [Chitinophagaceae bacterium]
MASTYNYLGKYNSNGRPEYLLPDNDKISEKTLSYINASLPENQPATKYHPEYLKETAGTNLDIEKSSDVWITFVYEGTKYRNSLAYFTYPTGKEPTSTKEIESLTVILPNASLSGSGGELTSGNKVKIGTFEPGTSIGFCLVVNGWNKETQKVEEGLNKFYSIDELNPEASESDKRHVVLLKDNEDKLILVGFESDNREKESDHDFNDLIFYATCNSATEISTGEITPIDTKNDSDGDGVVDGYDMFPKDPERAYINYYPNEKTYASIAFEDTWPNTGDYDMNDLVVDYRYMIIQNAKNQSVEIYANYVARASGASFRNGFGVQFPFSPKQVTSVTGSKITDKTVVVLNSNGCEAAQSKAVIIPFDDIYALMLPDGKTYINTQAGVPYIKPDTIKMKITFSSPLSLEELGAAPFNQFAISNKIRGKEIHLPGELPTDKANTALFNTAQDNTIPSENRYYKTGKNLPFAISIPQAFEYPYEGKMITNAYLKFVEWAQSGGESSADWYLDISGYRTNGSLYK